jgi:glycosyltransferase involved in cell wall biosynthesis
MKFSIIIPLYNKAPYIRKALETVCAQTYRDYEIIVVNDGSTDDSAVVAESYLQHAEGICYTIISQDNAGVAAARNRGVKHASGQYMAFLDADDWWEPDYLARMAELIEEYPQAGIYGCNYVYYKPGKTRVALNIPTGYINYPKAYYEGSAMPIWTGATIMPKTVLEEMGGFPLGIKLGEDFLLWAKTALHYKVVFLNEPLAYYNNDVPANMRATRNLHGPEHHMLFRLDLSFGDEKLSEDWQRLLDKLRVNGLLDYWMSDAYHEQAAEELKKVDWSQQPTRVKQQYKTPIWLLKIKRWIMCVGSYWKEKYYQLTK